MPFALFTVSFDERLPRVHRNLISFLCVVSTLSCLTNLCLAESTLIGIEADFLGLPFILR